MTHSSVVSYFIMNFIYFDRGNVTFKVILKMSDKYTSLKKVFDKLHHGKYYESDFSSSDVDTAIQELKTICQVLPILSIDTQVS